MKKMLTPRLTLVPSDKALISLCLTSPEAFARKLNVKLPSEWPTASLEEGIPWLLEEMKEEETGWWIWWMTVKPGDQSDLPLVIGNMGFKGPPNHAGAIEVTYSVVPEHQGRGFTKEALNALVSWAFEQPDVKKVWGDTTPDNIGSIKIFESSGFTLQDHESDEYYLLYSKMKSSSK